MIPIRDNIYCKKKPYVSWGIMAVCMVIFLLMKLMPLETQRQLTYLYGMVPIRYSNPQWAVAFGLPPDKFLSFLTNLFLHGGWVHLVFNMWFIWIFANSIENRMGHIRFLFFYLICGFIATFAQWYFDRQAVIPIVGASGAIAGILGAYFFLYPYARIVIWLPLLFLPIFFELPAISFLGFWVIMQMYKASTPLVFEGITTDVAWWAHLGGFVAGSFLYPLFLKGEEKNKE
ncbi:MAG: rhomboid family intramembrane serine protease [Methylococcaceae bacterium]|nr:rhomboid family intramembrane serine protease [Methylococcaceae bacterium]